MTCRQICYIAITEVWYTQGDHLYVYVIYVQYNNSQLVVIIRKNDRPLGIFARNNKAIHIPKGLFIPVLAL